MEHRRVAWDLAVRSAHLAFGLLVLGAFLTSEEDASIGLHARLGLVLLGVVLFRVGWGFVGPRYARFKDFVRSPRQVLAALKDMVRGAPKHFTGHNPVGAVMVVALLVTMLVVTLSGVVISQGPEWSGALLISKSSCNASKPSSGHRCSRPSKSRRSRFSSRFSTASTSSWAAEQLVKRLLWLIPPKSLHLTNFHGVFSSHSAARAALLPAATTVTGTKEAPAAQQSLSGAAEPAAIKRPRLDWATLHARTWKIDVWQCPCGGKRKVVAVVTSRRTAEELLRNLGLLPPRPPPLPGAQGPPQLELSL